MKNVLKRLNLTETLKSIQRQRDLVPRVFGQTWSFLLYFCSMCCTREGPHLHQRSRVLSEEVEFLLLC